MYMYYISFAESWQRVEERVSGMCILYTCPGTTIYYYIYIYICPHTLQRVEQRVV